MRFARRPPLSDGVFGVFVQRTGGGGLRLSLWESWRGAPERASPSPKSHHPAISRPSVRAILSPRSCFAMSILALSVSLRSPAPPKGEPLAGRSGPRGTSKVYSIRKQQCPATEIHSSLTRDIVPKLLPSVAGHYLLCHIELPASSGKLPGLPRALPLGELSPKVTERARMLS